MRSVSSKLWIIALISMLSEALADNPRTKSTILDLNVPYSKCELFLAEDNLLAKLKSNGAAQAQEATKVVCIKRMIEAISDAYQHLNKYYHNGAKAAYLSRWNRTVSQIVFHHYDSDRLNRDEDTKSFEQANKLVIQQLNAPDP